MDKLKIKVKLDEKAYMPVKAHTADAGFDLKIPFDSFIPPQGWLEINTGVHMLIPEGYVGFLKSKSGLNVKFGLRGEGVIDAEYTGPIVVKMYNDTDHLHAFNRGDKVIQIVILPIPSVELEEVEDFEYVDTFDARGDKGFGSSGR